MGSLLGNTYQYTEIKYWYDIFSHLLNSYPINIWYRNDSPTIGGFYDDVVIFFADTKVSYSLSSHKS